jgi:hypothetical protein
MANQLNRGTTLRCKFEGTLAESSAILMELQNRVNSEPWRGYDARTVRFIGPKMEGTEDRMIGHLEFLHKINEHKVSRANIARDGTRLDLDGNQLPDDAETIVLDWNVYESIDFNKLPIGEFAAN